MRSQSDETTKPHLSRVIAGRARPRSEAIAMSHLIFIVLVIFTSSMRLVQSTAAEDQAQDRVQSPIAATIADTTPAPASAPNGMVWIPGGEFSMGSDDPS